MPANILFLSEEEVSAVLKWDELVDSIEELMSDVSNKSANKEAITIQPARGIMPIPHKNGFLLTMPGFSERCHVLSCKLVTAFLGNPKRFNLPTIIANITLFDPETGRLKAIVAGTTITEWRTAAASVVATKHLICSRPTVVLAVLGAGRQGRIHIIAFHHFFKFKKIHLWNRTGERSELLARELEQNFGIKVEVFQNVHDCTSEADVIITATHTSEPILKYEDVKPNALINAIGAGTNHHSELDKTVYEKSRIYTDSLDNAAVELRGLTANGFPIAGEVGDVINGHKEVPELGLVIFHSLGMATEDAVAANLVLSEFLCSGKSSTVNKNESL